MYAAANISTCLVFSKYTLIIAVLQSQDSGLGDASFQYSSVSDRYSSFVYFNL